MLISSGKYLPSKRLTGVFFIFCFWLGFFTPAQALPSFTRQTNMACTACHTQAYGPNLNSYGRAFKLNGYLWGTNNSIASRLGGSIEGSFTNTKKSDPRLTDPNNANYDPNFGNRSYNSNNNLAFDQATVYYGGKVYGQMGAAVQFMYDGVTNRFSVDESDIRLSDENDWLGQNFVYGVSFNNNPTVQDLWNTTAAWSFPYVNSPIAQAPGAAPIVSSLGGQIGGASLYGMINDFIYLEAGAYTSLAKYAQKGMGQWDTSNPNYTANTGSVKVDGGAPYWRIALQKEWQGHYAALGHFGFQSNIQADATIPGTDRLTDLGADFTYQYLGNPLHIFEFKSSYIREQQQLSATQTQGGASQANQQLGFLAINGSYTYLQTYSLTMAYNHTYGNSDVLLYSGSPTFKPNSEYFTFELDYVPFGKSASAGLESYMNVRFAAQYTAYTLFDGAAMNYDGLGRNASDNNTLYFNSQLSF
jgi:hypothetical protein